MSSKIKKSVSILLALLMLCGVLAVAPVAVHAEELQVYETSTGGKYSLIPDEENPGMYVLHLIEGSFTGTAWEHTQNYVSYWDANWGEYSGEDVISITVDDDVNTPEKDVKITGDCSYMFKSYFPNCKSIDFSNADTSGIGNMNLMFAECHALEILNIYGFKSSGRASKQMFAKCENLKELLISTNFQVISSMQLNNGKISDKGWIESDSVDGNIVSGTGDYAVITPDDSTTYIWAASSPQYIFNEQTGVLHLISGFFRGTTWQYTIINTWESIWTALDFEGKDVLSITAGKNVKFANDCSFMFKSNFPNCTSIDLHNVDTSNVKKMTGMFLECNSLESVNLSGFDTTKVSGMKDMFAKDPNLSSLDLSSFDMNSVDSTYMFDESIELKELTISDKFIGGINAGMKLNNNQYENIQWYNGWRVKGDPEANKVSGNGGVAVITNPDYLPGEGETKTYKWIGYFDVDWKNWDGTKLVKTEEYKAETNIHPTYKGATPTKPDSDGKRYTFAGWTDGENTYGVDYELPLVTNDVTYTAVFSETPKKFFAAHSISLDGDIGVNFYIDVTVAGITPEDIISGDSTLTLNFSWDTDPAPVTDVSKDNFTLSKSNASRYYDEDKGYFKIKCNVAAAEMACKIKADGIVAGAKDYTESEIYSVRDYGMTIINNPSKYSETLVDLAKKLLDYGAKAQKVFKILPGDLANKDVSYTMTNVSANDIQAAIEAESANAGKTASNMASGTSDFGLKYSQSTVVYLTKSTLRHYYLISDQEKYDNVKANFSERKLPYVYIEYSNIAAADLDKLQTFTIDSKHTYYYSALNYAKDVIGSNSPDANKKLAMAMYWYNQAANAYFK